MVLTHINDIQKACEYSANKSGWVVVWDKKKLKELLIKQTPEDKIRYLSIGDAIALIHSEGSEALEAFRDGNRQEFALELADMMIRIFHMAGDCNISMSDALNTKMAINLKRLEHHGRKNL